MKYYSPSVSITFLLTSVERVINQCHCVAPFFDDIRQIKLRECTLFDHIVCVKTQLQVSSLFNKKSNLLKI